MASNLSSGTPLENDGALSNRPRRSRLWQLPLFVIGLMTLACAWAFHTWWYDPEAHRIARILEKAREQLASADGVNKTTLNELEDAIHHCGRFPERLGEAHFLLGSACIKLAERQPPDGRAKPMWLRACDELEEARGAGIEAAERMRLNYLLAKAHYYAGVNPHVVGQELLESVEFGAENPAEGYNLLTRIFLDMKPPNYPAALDANAKLIQLPATDEKILMPARLQRAEILLAMKEREPARKILTRIGADAPAAILQKARMLLAYSYQEENNWNEAAPLWEALLADPAVRERGPILYWLGLCYERLNRSADAEATWKQVAGTPTEAGQAAALRLGQLHADAGRDAIALDMFRRALGHLKKTEDYRNALLDLQEARTLLQNSCRQLLQLSRFESAAALANLSALLGPVSKTAVLQAEVAEGWAAAHRKTGADSKNEETANQEKAAAKSEALAAATAYEAAADAADASAPKADLLMRAATNYRQAAEPARTVTALERLVKLASEPALLGEGWYRLGEAHLVLHNDTAADGSFRRCIEYPSSFAYLARCQLAEAEEKRGNWGNAEEYLQQNLKLMKDTESEPYERTLYDLCRVLYIGQKYLLAVNRLEYALKVHPANPQAAQARFMLAECYRRLADTEFGPDPNPNGLRPQMHRLQTQRLEAAAANYQKVVDDLEARRSTQPLSETDRQLWRDAYFAFADCRYNEGDYTDAARIYETLTGLFQHEYAGLEAFRMLYICYEALAATNRSNLLQARATIQRALYALNELEETVFKEPNRKTREDWEKLFKRAEEELRKMGGPDPGP